MYIWKKIQEHVLDVCNILEQFTTIDVIIFLQNPATGLIVLSGCGTSGRMGFITAVSFVDTFLWSLMDL